MRPIETEGLSMSTRRIEGRLFPAIKWDHGWSLSLQADRSGYQCFPKERFETLEEYSAVEAVIYGPFSAPVDPSTLELPTHVVQKFVPLDVSAPSIGCKLTWDDVLSVKGAILRASLHPNAGVPRGVIGWSLQNVYHGASLEDAEGIVERGISIHKSAGGYFGQAFYVAEDEALARSNYADFSDGDEAGAVVSFEIKEAARIIDMRNSVDAAFWTESGLAEKIGMKDFARLAVQAGVDGVYDRSFGGLAIYNSNAVECRGLIPDNRPVFK